MITEPLYGISSKHPRAEQFWLGSPKYEGYTLLDQFILYHSEVMVFVHIDVNVKLIFMQDASIYTWMYTCMCVCIMNIHDTYLWMTHMYE